MVSRQSFREYWKYKSSEDDGVLNWLLGLSAGLIALTGYVVLM